jgi:hypothetical protein
MRTSTKGQSVSRRLGALIVALSSVAACATPAPTGRIIPLVPGYPLSADSMSAEPGEQLTWVNGDPARGEIQLEFDRGPSMPEVSSKAGVYTARFGAAGTYPYTVTGLSRSGVQLVPRRGEVVVRERTPAGAPGAPGPEAPAPGRPSSPPPRRDTPPVGADISRLKSSAEVYLAHQYQSEHGIVLKVERGATAPSSLRPGSPVVLAVTYTILAPPEVPPLVVKETRTIRFGDQDLRRLEKTVTVGPGTYSSEHRLLVPPDAAEGPYTVTTTIELPSAARIRGQVSSTFSVRLP